MRRFASVARLRKRALDSRLLPGREWSVTLEGLRRAPEEAAIPATPRQSPAVTVDPTHVLMELLDAAYGDPHGGRVLVQAGLRASRRATLPTDHPSLLAFVRAHLVGPLAAELGPRVVAAFLEDLEQRLRDLAPRPDPLRASASVPTRRSAPAPTSSYAPASSGVRMRPSVLLVDPDRFARASLARALIAASFDVVPADGPLDVRSVDADVDVAIVDMRHPESAAILGALQARAPDIRVIGVANDAASAEALLRAAGVRTWRVVPKSMRPGEMGELVRRLASG